MRLEGLLALLAVAAASATSHPEFGTGHVVGFADASVELLELTAATGLEDSPTGAAVTPEIVEPLPTPVDEDELEEYAEATSEIAPMPAPTPLNIEMRKAIPKLPSSHSGSVYLSVSISISGIPASLLQCGKVLAAIAELLDPALGVGLADMACLGPATPSTSFSPSMPAPQGESGLAARCDPAPGRAASLRAARARADQRTAVVVLSIHVHDGSFVETVEAQLVAMMDDQRLEANLARHRVVGTPSFFAPPVISANSPAAGATGAQASGVDMEAAERLQQEESEERQREEQDEKRVEEEAEKAVRA